MNLLTNSLAAPNEPDLLAKSELLLGEHRNAVRASSCLLITPVTSDLPISLSLGSLTELEKFVFLKRFASYTGDGADIHERFFAENL